MAMAMVEASTMQDFKKPWDMPANIDVLLTTALVASLAVLIAWLARRPALHRTAPALSLGAYPVVGMARFFTDRRNFYYEAITASGSGHFSFYVGKRLIVGVSGYEGRKVFYENKDLSMNAGVDVFFTSVPRAEDTTKPSETGTSSYKWPSKMITSMMRKSYLVKYLPLLVVDTRAHFEGLVSVAGPSGTFDPFHDIYRIVYQLSMRTFGAKDIADSPVLLGETLRLFEQIESSESPARIVFPWLPTLAHRRRLEAGARLYAIFDKILQERKASRTRGDDALQYLQDNGGDIVKTISVVLDMLLGAQFNSAINAAWVFVYLACNPEWYGIVQREVDAAVTSHRTSPAQNPADILSALTLEEWEAEFPMLDLCLRECIRLQLVGTGFRRNVSGRDLPLGKSGEVVPAGAFVVYLVDDVHMDPDVYPDPDRWDPGRYLSGRAGDKKHSLGFVGWGSGRNPCLGMRFAKVEMAIIGALFVAMFDYELTDVNGVKMGTSPCTNRNNHAYVGNNYASAKSGRLTEDHGVSVNPLLGVTKIFIPKSTRIIADIVLVHGITGKSHGTWHDEATDTRLA